MLIQFGEYLAVDFRIGHNQEIGIISLHGIDIRFANVRSQLNIFVFTAPFIDATCSTSQLVTAQSGSIGCVDSSRRLCINVIFIYD
ncbi:hypothetical protein D3C71_2032780 [compost metagenome]